MATKMTTIKIINPK